jgi:hypothetical protein
MNLFIKTIRGLYFPTSLSRTFFLAKVAMVRYQLVVVQVGLVEVERVSAAGLDFALVLGDAVAFHEVDQAPY